MENDARKLLHKSLYQLMLPLARVSLSFGVSVKDLYELAKKAYVDIARESYGVRGRPTNKSRVAAITGLTRQEVNRLVERTVDEHAEGIRPQSLQRVVNYWLREPAYLDDCDSAGKAVPMEIAVSGEAPSFEHLAHLAGGDVPYQSLLKELLRLQIVSEQKSRVQLLRHGYLPGDGSEERIPFLGSDGGAMIDTIGHNLLCEPPQLRVQRKVAFDSLTPQGERLLQQFAAARGQQFLEELDRLLAPHQQPAQAKDAERQAEADDSRPPAMIGLGLFVFDTRSSKGSGK